MWKVEFLANSEKEEYSVIFIAKSLLEFLETNKSDGPYLWSNYGSLDLRGNDLKFTEV